MLDDREAMELEVRRVYRQYNSPLDAPVEYSDDNEDGDNGPRVPGVSLHEALHAVCVAFGSSRQVEYDLRLQPADGLHHLPVRGTLNWNAFELTIPFVPGARLSQVASYSPPAQARG